MNGTGLRARATARLWSMRRDERGIALLTVLWIALAATALTATMVALTSGALRSSTNHDNFDTAMASAESGIDDVLGRVQANQSYTAGSDAPWSTPPSAESERTWARGELLSRAASAGTIKTGTGEYVAIRPSNLQTVYAMGWSPSKDAPNAVARMVKAEYLFAPYKPGSAILTAGNLSFSSSVTVDVTAGVVGGKANVHTNGQASGTGCSQTVNGTVTSTGSYSVCNSVGDTGSGQVDSLESVPDVNARFVYDNYATSYPTSWYDLCPDGIARVPSSSGPCKGVSALNGNVSGGGTFRGWSYASGSGQTAPVWSMNSTSWGSGIYYVYQGDANISRQTTVSAATVIAEGKSSGGPSDRCGMYGGRIDAALVGISSAALPGIVMMADDDLSVTANFEGGIGLFGAGNQVHLETSSNGITGTVIANDKCTAGGDSNQVKNAVVRYDKNVEVPLLTMVRTTQWLELKAKA